MRHRAFPGSPAGRRVSALLGLTAVVLGVAMLVFAAIFVATSGIAGGGEQQTAGGSNLDGAVEQPDARRQAGPTAPTTGGAREPRPVRIAIPAIGVSAPVIPLGLDAGGALEVPEDFSDAGWWTGGARPGERGPAVIAGHLDSHTGAAVFFRLGDLRRGDAITIERADGSRVGFRVAGAERYAKDRFPTARVYGPTATPELRLITCSGMFDRQTGHYLDNTVVYARR